MAPLEKVRELRAKGYDVSEDLTKIECQRLELIDTLRAAGMAVPLDVTFPDLERLTKIQALRSHGVQVCDSATASEVAILHDSWYKVRHFFSKVAGASHRNRDGSYRQRTIRQLKPFECLQLEREPGNPVDPFAVAVLRQNGEQLGYIPGEICPRMCEQIEQEYRLGAWVVAITGGQPDKPTLGVNLLILVGDPGVSDESFVAYFNRRISTDQAFLAETGATSVFMDPKNL